MEKIPTCSKNVVVTVLCISDCIATFSNNLPQSCVESACQIDMARPTRLVILFYDE